MRRLLASLFSRTDTSQPHPDVRLADVQRIAKRDFPSDPFEAVLAALKQYGTESWENERFRVQLAALKLANGDLPALRRYIHAAKLDYRDVLATAEYPEYSRVGMFEVPKLPRAERRRIVDQDWAQYEEWLRK